MDGPKPRITLTKASDEHRNRNSYRPTILTMPEPDTDVSEISRYTNNNRHHRQSLADDDNIAFTVSSSSSGTPDYRRRSPESFTDVDSAIVVIPPSTSESGSGSPEIIRKNFSDAEERFECYGEAEDIDDGELEPSSSLANGRSHSPTSCRSPATSQPFQRRTTWLRTSLRRSPSERRRLSSNALASQLYRSSSFNSGRQSSSGESDDMHGDFSLEEDVLDLNQKVHMLQQQVSALAHTQSTNDDKYGRVKQDNAALQARTAMLEEQIRELELRSEERVREEQKRYKELLSRHEREKSLEIETYTLRLQTIEKDNVDLREELFRLKSQLDKLKQEKYSTQEQLSESEYTVLALREENSRLQEVLKKEREESVSQQNQSGKMVEDMAKELQDLKRYKAETESQSRTLNHSMLELPSKFRDLEDTVRRLKGENQLLRDANDELQAQLLNTSIAEGRSLLHSGVGNSIAAEFEAMSKDEVMEALREQQEVNAKLRKYIDGILLSIVENYPQLLEVKGNIGPK